MIQEIINFTKHLKENSSWIFEHKLEPSKGIHLFIELDEEGNHINWPPEKGKDWDYYDGKNGKSEFLNEIIDYQLASDYISMNKQKKFDAKQKIHSASPFVVSFNFKFNDTDKTTLGIKQKPKKSEKDENLKLIKTKRIEIIKDRLDDYFKNCINVFLKNEFIKFSEKILFLKKAILECIDMFPEAFDKEWEQLKETDYLRIYLKNISLDTYELIYNEYLSDNIFNKDIYNIEANEKTFGVLDYRNTFSDNKPFLKHKTSSLKDGVSYRFVAHDAKTLSLFSKLIKSKALPNPLPIFIDKNEFKDTTNEIIKIYNSIEDRKPTYSEILKDFFSKNKNTTLKNYYLLFLQAGKISDFDFVSKFEYKLTDCKIRNLFKIATKEKELIPDRNIHTIFGFESNVVKEIFNNSLVSVNSKTEEFKVKYFDEIKPEYVSGGEPVYQMILKYRKAFYDYIYKSKRTAINPQIWDEILWNTIIADLRNENYFNILRKLNIWFSLYNFFNHTNLNRDNMASLIPQLTEKMREVANNDNVHFENEKEFAFGAGQVIYFLLTKSASADKKHSMLEPFLQKVKAEQLQNAVSVVFATYKHEVDFGHGRFERLAKEVLAFDTEANLKNYQRFLLAGYFAPPVIFEKSAKNETIEQE